MTEKSNRAAAGLHLGLGGSGTQLTLTGSGSREIVFNNDNGGDHIPSSLDKRHKQPQNISNDTGVPGSVSDLRQNVAAGQIALLEFNENESGE